MINKGDNITFIINKISFPALTGNQMKCQLSTKEISGIIKHIKSDSSNGSEKVIFHLEVENGKIELIDSKNIVGYKKNE